MVGRGWWIHTTGRPPASPGRAKHPGVTVAVPQPECLQTGNGVSEGRDLFKEHLVLFREGFSSFFSSSELSATDVFSSSSFSSRFISLVPEETLLRPSPPDKPAEEAEGVGASWGGGSTASKAGGSLALPHNCTPSPSPPIPPFPGSEPSLPPAAQGPGAPCTHSRRDRNTQHKPEATSRTSGKGSAWEPPGSTNLMRAPTPSCRGTAACARAGLPYRCTCPAAC